mgnify:CR=1 FL=1
MTPSLFAVNTNLNINSEKKLSQKSDLRSLFLIRESKNDHLCFFVALKNSGDKIINQIWFTALVGIGKTGVAPGWDDQDNFYFRTFLGQYLTGYTKESVKLPPEAILEILYFEIPKDKLSEAGSLEFYYGCESVKKFSFAATWEKGEISKHLAEVNTQNFINFLKFKNQKHLFQKISILSVRIYKCLKKIAKGAKKIFVREKNF